MERGKRTGAFPDRYFQLAVILLLCIPHSLERPPLGSTLGGETESRPQVLHVAFRVFHLALGHPSFLRRVGALCSHLRIAGLVGNTSPNPIDILVIPARLPPSGFYFSKYSGVFQYIQSNSFRITDAEPTRFVAGPRSMTVTNA